MKKVFSLIIVLAMSLTMFMGISVAPSAFAATEELRIYNWADYMDSTVVDDFKDYYLTKGIALNVVYSIFDTNEMMLTNISSGDAKVDLICPSEYAIERLMSKNLLQKMDYSQIPNLDNLDERLYTKVDEFFGNIAIGGQDEVMSDFFVPYMMGTLGILYNEDVVTQKDLEAGWGLLWNKNNNRKLNKKILMKDSIRDAYAAAVLYLKENDRLPEEYKNLSVQTLINTVDKKLLSAVEDVLIEQKEVIKDYEVDFGKDELVTGKAYLDLAWSGDALWAMEDAENLNYFVPEIGSNIWFDGWAIPKNAPNTTAAYEFINFLLRPEIAIRNSMEIGYTNCIDIELMMANAEVIAILEENEYDVEEYFNNELRYPNMSGNLGVMKDFGAMNDDVVAMWERVRAEGSKIWILIVVGVGIVAIGGGLLAFFAFKNNKGKRRVKR